MADPAWPGELLWRESWDHYAHGFRTFGELTSTGLCGHDTRTSSLPSKDPPDYIRRCVACLLIHGQELAARRGDGTDWSE